MARLIDADEIKLPQGFFEKVDNVPKFYEWLGTLPTVDAEPRRHGRWVKPSPKGIVTYDEHAYAECSVCHKAEYLGYGMAYCPTCGAKMDEVKDND